VADAHGVSAVQTNPDTGVVEEKLSLLREAMMSFAEGLSVSVHEPLRQGDVLEARDPDAVMWHRHLLVVTADCDLAHGKNHGRITSVPFLTADEYISALHFSKTKARHVREITNATQQLLLGSKAEGLSDLVLAEWARSSPIAEILEDAETDPSTAADLTEHLAVLRLLQEEQPTVASTSEVILRARALVSPARQLQSLNKELGGEIEAAFTSTPGDALFISEISPGLKEGYFAYLRHHETLWQSDIALSYGRAESPYRRVGRLQDRFTHALVQRFATVFMAIGLPDDYETTRNMHANVMKEVLT
jgi:hypothetical protein